MQKQFIILGLLLLVVVIAVWVLIRYPTPAFS
ncbi:hypothetical protein Cflav_PD0029 [Pedosphaera parvula Ellin514]|uniref:Uncharacterized protein n=1 Tax=Pedosphaera parvula (strain Ellin514) TaxID=320771 RepID=B9XT33_PEDPL|nr:hypothetical protein Cflav_PD0029 [Pedosphaera parvula Ellin514]